MPSWRAARTREPRERQDRAVRPRVLGGSGFTADSLAKAVDLLRSREVRTDIVAGEVFGLDDLETALALLGRKLPGRDAVRVTLVHG